MFDVTFYIEEVHETSDLIELKLATEDEAECHYRLQVESFMLLYEKYQDVFIFLLGRLYGCIHIYPVTQIIKSI